MVRNYLQSGSVLESGTEKECLFYQTEGVLRPGITVMQYFCENKWQQPPQALLYNVRFLRHSFEPDVEVIGLRLFLLCFFLFAVS